MNKNEKRLSKGTLSIILVIVLLASFVPLYSVFAAVPGTGVVPVNSDGNNYFLIETKDMTTAAPGSLADGQVWTNKDVVKKGSEAFTITYSAWGRPYNGEHLLKEGTGVRFEDIIGAQFEVVGSPAELSIEGSKVTYTFDASEIDKASPATFSFDVTLKSGWATDVWYPTNEGATAYFTPVKENEFYWMTKEILEEVFEITGFSWNDGNLLNTITFNEIELGFGTFTMERDKAIVQLLNGARIVPAARLSKPGDVEAPAGKWSYYVSATIRPGAIKDYFFWFMLPNGDLYEFEADVNNPGGNVGRAGRLFITYKEATHKRTFVWVTGGDEVMTSLLNTGKLKINYDESKVYKVEYNANGGDTGSVPVDNERYIAGDEAEVMSGTPTWRGHRFLNWNTDPSREGITYIAEDRIEDIDNNVTLYAQWEPLPEFNVIYDANGGENAPTDPNGPYYEYETVTVLGKGAMTKPGYKFTGWKTISEEDVVDYEPGDEIEAPPGGGYVTLIAQWEAVYTVKYDRNGGTGTVPADANEYSEGDAVTVKEKGSISKGSDRFIGWNTRADGDGVWLQPGEEFEIPDDVLADLNAENNSITLYAQWKPVYTVTYNKNGSTGGSAPTDKNSPYLAGDDVTVLGSNGLTKTGYTFMGWSTRSDGTGDVYHQNDHFRMPSANVTLYAIWQSNSITRLYYHLNGGTGTPPADATIYAPGQEATVKSDSAGGGMSNGTKVFAGWNTQANGSGKWYFPGDNLTMPAGNENLYAQWADEADVHKVVYHGNENDGGAAPTDNNNYIEGVVVTVKGQGSLTNTGYKFIGWNTRADGDGDWYHHDDTFAMPDENVDLYAIWVDEAVTTYRIKYHGNGNTGGTEPVDDNEYVLGADAHVKDKHTLERAGWTFKGWNTMPDGSGVWIDPDDIIRVGEDTDLYAQWEPDEKHTVTYNANGGEGEVPEDDNDYSHGETVTVKDKNTLNKQGHTFIGWNTERDGSGTWYVPDHGDTFEMPDESVTLYAQWDPSIWYKVIYDANGGANAPVDDNQYFPETDVDVIFSPRPTRSGYTFLGWSTDPKATTAQYSSSREVSFVITEDTTLYAVWVVNTGGPTGTQPPDEQEKTVETTPGPGPRPPVETEEPGDDEYEDGGDEGENGNNGNNGGGRDDGGNVNTNPVVVFPEGKGPESFPEINFNKKQPNQDVPGGTVRDAPPVPNNSENKLQPQYNDDGDLIFIEFDLEDVPLGAWSWDGDEFEGMWVFEDFDVPLGEWEMDLPQTGYFNAMLWLLPLGLAIFGFGIILKQRFARILRKSKR